MGSLQRGLPAMAPTNAPWSTAGLPAASPLMRSCCLCLRRWLAQPVLPHPPKGTLSNLGFQPQILVIDEPQPDINVHVTPAAKLGQSGAFGGLAGAIGGAELGEDGDQEGVLCRQGLGPTRLGIAILVCGQARKGG